MAGLVRQNERKILLHLLFFYFYWFFFLSANSLQKKNLSYFIIPRHGFRLIALGKAVWRNLKTFGEICLFFLIAFGT